MTTMVLNCTRQPLDRQIHDARMRQFCGRNREVAAFRAALADRVATFTLVYLSGPGGIGKSTMLSRFVEEARNAGRPVLLLEAGADDCGAGEPGPAAPVVLIDDLHLMSDPEQWLRRQVIPAFPPGTVFAVASRLASSVEWRGEPGWSDMLLSLPLEPLTAAESASLLRSHGVPAERLEGVLHICGGHPLALRFAALTIAADPDGLSDEDLRRELALAIHRRLIGDLPSIDHGRALAVCAHAATTTENLLRAAIPGADAGALFSWLRDLPFITAGPRGLFPSAVVRTVVTAELRWRDPDQFAAMHERMMNHLLTRVRAVADEVVLPVVADVIHLQRLGRRSQADFADIAGYEVQDHPYRPGDRAEVCRMAAQAEGPETAALVEFWLDRQPQAFRVQRRHPQPEIVAFTGQLVLKRPDPVELRTDPVVATAWQRTQSIAPLRSGEHVNLIRFLVDPHGRMCPSDITKLMQVQVSVALLRADRLAWSVTACPDSHHWHTRVAHTHPRDDGPPVIIDGRPITLFSVYCGSQDISAWSGAIDDGLLDRRPRATAAPDRAAAFWDRTKFDAEVRLVLRSWRRSDLLADCGLIDSRMVGETGQDDAVVGLRQVFTAALDILGEDPRQARYHRALVTTFLQGTPTQEAAAERLGLPFSTYRRHLTRGIDELSALLWRSESHGLRSLGSRLD